MKKVVIDPITRIEGHLRIEVEVDENNIVKEAYASGQLFRGLEIILQNRDPRDVGLIAGRICGVCTNSHFRAAVSAVENAYKITIPKNAQILRDLMSMALFIQDHVVHFYQLHLLDYVDVLKALEADIKSTTKEAHKYTSHPFRNSNSHYETILEKLKNFIDAGRLGPFNSNYFGHSDYKLSAEQNLILLSHYFEALTFQTKISKAIAIFGGKTPHPQSIVVGGVTSVVDMLNPQRLNDFLFVIKEASEFISRAYIPDMKLLSLVYKDEIEKKVGKTLGNYFSVGGYEVNENMKLFSSGVIFNNDFSNIEKFDSSKITEEVQRAWYDDTNPQEPFYTDLNADGTLKTQNSDDKYSWIKAPRYDNLTMETGSIARVTISYLNNDTAINSFVDEFLESTSLKLEDLNCTIGRNIARAIESQYICEYIFKLMSNLMQNIKYDDTNTFTNYDFNSMKKDTNDSCLLEVPRGVLLHSINIKDTKVKNYQVIAPTTWNATPKNYDGVRGAYEEALIGIKIEDLSKPLEVLKVIHSFDPCLACAVHIINTKGKDLSRFKLL